MTPLRAALCAAVALACFAAPVIAAPAVADVPTPRIKPTPVHASSLLSSTDMAALKAGLAAAERGAWGEVRAREAAIKDPTARDILAWKRATQDPAASFGELDYALTALAAWPNVSAIRQGFEEKIGDARLSPSEVVRRLEADAPETGAGLLALADAYFALGREDEAVKALKTVWRQRALPIDIQRDALARHRGRLTKDDHIARVDYLLWRGQRSAASALYPLIPSSHRALADARVKLAVRAKGVDTAIERVPAALKEHPGLNFERARWRRVKGMTDAAEPLIASLPEDLGSPAAAAAAWQERKLYVSRALKRGDVKAAYELAARHGLSEGVDFADAEWLAGWLALRKLNQAEAALKHFSKLEANVTTPISKSRGAYWAGRAAEALSRPDEARAAYTRAASFQVTYYGQLAAERLGGEAIVKRLPNEAAPTDADRASFAVKPLVRALDIAADLNDDTLFEALALALDDTLETPVEYAMLAERARAYGEPRVAVRSAKTGLAKGIVEPGSAYPVIALNSLPSDAPEAAFLHALMRQESEFDPRAVSRAGARGMMQLMPRTAQAQARIEGVSYKQNWLIDDPDYNIRLGASHLRDLVDDFRGSYILATAAYNAGGSRSRAWIQDYGDPRGGGVDAIDWVESIPFSETRNYVQRVMENLQVYRGRLNDEGVTKINLEYDLKRGAKG